MISEAVSGDVSCSAASCWSENGAEHGYVQISQVLVWVSGMESRTSLEFCSEERDRARDAVTGALLSPMLMRGAWDGGSVP